MFVSYNFGGLEEDFGVKYNISNGGFVLEKVISVIYECSKVIDSYKIFEVKSINLD